jgi:gliding motility-associated protein GldM
MNKHSTDRFDGLAKNASEDPTLKNNSDQKNKDYAHLNYGQMPMVAALAVLSETEAKILNMENSVVTAIADSLRLEDYTVDHMMPVVKPQSDFVVAGTKYNAEMFMAATSSAAKPQMTMGSSILSVDNNGVGSLSFIASGGNYKPDGTMKKTWTGSIKMKNQRGQDTTYMITHEYTVVKPVIQVQSGTVPQLYKNCGNKLNISVPALGAAYHPSFRVEGASVINGDRPGVVTLVPTSARVRVGVTNNGSFLGEELFGVKLIPKPTIDVKVNNQKVPPLEGLPANAPRIMTVRIIPDITFAQNLPEECRYFAEGTITLARRKTKMKEIPFNGIQIPLNAFAGLMQPGDRIIVEVSKVRRKNFKNEMEDVNMERYFETIILN